MISQSAHKLIQISNRTPKLWKENYQLFVLSNQWIHDTCKKTCIIFLYSALTKFLSKTAIYIKILTTKSRVRILLTVLTMVFLCVWNSSSVPVSGGKSRSEPRADEPHPGGMARVLPPPSGGETRLREFSGDIRGLRKQARCGERDEVGLEWLFFPPFVS